MQRVLQAPPPAARTLGRVTEVPRNMDEEKRSSRRSTQKDQRAIAGPFFFCGSHLHVLTLRLSSRASNTAPFPRTFTHCPRAASTSKVLVCRTARRTYAGSMETTLPRSPRGAPSSSMQRKHFATASPPMLFHGARTSAIAPCESVMRTLLVRFNPLWRAPRFRGACEPDWGAATGAALAWRERDQMTSSTQGDGP